MMNIKLLEKMNTNIKFMYHGLPNILRELNIIEKEIGKIENTILRNTAIDSFYAVKDDCFCYSVFETFPYVDKENCAKFISSVVVLTGYIKAICSRKDLIGSECSKYLYASILDAILTERPIGDYYKKCPYKNDAGYLTYLVNRCRSAIEMLPYYNLIKPALQEYILKYYSFYTNVFLSVKVYDSIISWAEPINDKSWLITCMEYSAACSNLSLIFALFVTGFDRTADNVTIKDVIYFYFPWVNTLYSLMDSYVSLQYLNENDNININFCQKYANQKICEDRILYFYKMIYENVHIISNSYCHTCFLKLFISRFLSDHGAYTGINTITSKNITSSLKKISKSSSNNLYRFIRVIGTVAAG